MKCAETTRRLVCSRSNEKFSHLIYLRSVLVRGKESSQMSQGRTLLPLPQYGHAHTIAEMKAQRRTKCPGFIKYCQLPLLSQRIFDMNFSLSTFFNPVLVVIRRSNLRDRVMISSSPLHSVESAFMAQRRICHLN